MMEDLLEFEGETSPEFIIEKGIPLPLHRKNKYLWVRDMEVGDSVDVSAMTKKNRDCLASSIRNIGRDKMGGAKFTILNVNKDKITYRMWRIK